MLRLPRPWSVLVCALFLSTAAAQSPVPAQVATLLAEAKAASGGSAWDGLQTQHSKLTLAAGGVAGSAERWSDILTGRSYLRYTLGPLSGGLGFDGHVPWSQDASGLSRHETSEIAQQLAVNAAYRDQLAFWYPERHPAKFVHKDRAYRDGALFDVVGITPEGGREFDLWINTETKLIERMVEPEGGRERTEIYMDLRDVQGVKVPFRVRTNRGDPRTDEVFVVDALEYNAPLAGVPFTRPQPPRANYAFPPGRTMVEVPFQVMNGHLYMQVGINGQGPFLMLFDTGSASVLFPALVEKVAARPKGPAPAQGVPTQEVVGVEIDRLELSGLTLSAQKFAVVDLSDYTRRVEGLDEVVGIIGHELYRRFPIKLDFARQRAIVYDPASFKYQGPGTPVPFTFDGNVPQVRGSLDGVEGAFDIDAGARTSLVITAPFAADNALPAKYAASTDVIAGASTGGTSRALLARATTLRLGDVAVTRPVTLLSTATRGPLANPNLAGNVGYGVLRRFDLTFDYANNVIYFEPNPNNAEPDVYDRAGLWLERGDDGFRIVDVVPAGAAARAGLVPGNIVVAVDGKSWRTISLPALRTLLRGPVDTRVALTLSDGGERIVTLADLI
jgi:hypothetical protein